jgi:hypothetical protein
MIFHDHTLRAKFPALTYAVDSWDELHHQNVKLRHALHDALLEGRAKRRQSADMPLIASACLCAGVSLGVLLGRLLP